MAESNVAAVKVFNFIVGNGGYSSVSNLLKHPSPLAKKSSVSEVETWLRTQSETDGRFVLFRNQHGRILGVRIDLKKRMCLQYCTTGSCRSKNKCTFWHICKKYIEGSCKGDCNASHDFHDEENVEKTNELGFEAKANGVIRNMVAGSLPQICLKYLKNECVSDKCPYLHVCSNVVRVNTCGGECPLSHDFADPHNKTVLRNYGFAPPHPSVKVGVVACNVMVPKQQKSFEDSCVSGSIGPVNVVMVPKQQKRFEDSRMSGSIGRVNAIMIPKQQKSFEDSCVSGSIGRVNAVMIPKQQKSFEDSRVSGSIGPINAKDSRLFQGKLPSPSGIKVLMEGDAVDAGETSLVKVFNYVCSRGGLAYLSELVKHPSPLAKKFPGHESAAKFWIQSHSVVDSKYRLAVVEHWGGDSAAVRVDLRRKICVNYFKKGSCGLGSKCKFWHICKGYIEGKCKSTCKQGHSHDFFDADNEAKTKEVGLEVHPSGTVRKIVCWSLPHVCPMYLSNGCNVMQCPFLHVCASTAQGCPCQCVLSHDLADLHNKAVLQQYGLVPSKTLRLEIVHCNILIPELLGSGVKAFSSLILKDDPQVPQDKEPTRISGVKKKGIRKRRSKRESNQQGKQQEELDDSEEELPDWENNEDKLKPDFYSRIKFIEDPIARTAQQQEVRVDHSSTPRDLSNNPAASRTGNLVMASSLNVLEENLIDLSDDLLPDMQGVDSSMDDLWSLDSKPLSQLDEIFFDDWFSPEAAESLSQDSTFSLSDPIAPRESQFEGSNDNRVFECLCKEFNCRVPFSVISKRQELFPLEVTDIAKWFRARPNKFMLTEKNNGETDEVRAYSPRVRLCFRYLSNKRGCKDPKCFRFHVCKHYIANGECPFGKRCRFSHSHSLKSQHNKTITRALKLHGFSEEQLRLLVGASVPEVCQDFNNHSCQRGARCIGIHICKRFVMGRCKNGDMCPFGHQAALQAEHATMVLKKYKLTKVPLGFIFGMLLVRQVHATNRPICQADTSFPYICLEFLLGHCSKEPLCEYHHSNMPYLWQYRKQESQDKWKSFTQSENEDIERQFCNVKTGTTVMKNIMIPPPPSLLIHPGEGDVKMNFIEMKGKTEFEVVELRRLSTKSALSPTDHALFTKWAWHWLDENGSWREFGGPLASVKPEQIESSFMRDSSFFKFSAGGENHKLFFRTVPMYEQTVTSPQESSSRNEVRRRPVFRSNAEIEKLKSPFELLVPIEPEANPGMMELVPGRFPSQWTTVPETEEFIRVDLQPHSEQYKLVESLFRQSLSETKATIASIERVQNPFLWEKYARKREQMEKKAASRESPLNEKVLFHGADHENVDIICENNIDWRLNEDRAGAFGQGAYFTVEAALSKLYCNEDNTGWRFMFLAEVLVGSYTQGTPTIKRPPSREDSTLKKELYDSCVDNVERPTIYVLFNPDQYYPSFLIKYRLKTKVVC